MGGNPGLDNGEALMRAYREALMRAQQQALNQYNPYTGPYGPPQLTPAAWSNPQPPTPGERETEDVTGLRMLDEFLRKRRCNKGE